MVELILILMLLCGMLSLFYAKIEIMLEWIRYKVREIKVFLEKDDYMKNLVPETLYEKIFLHIGRLLQAAFFVENRMMVIAFMALSLGAGTVSFILAFGIVPLYLSIFIFVAACFLPYLLLLGQVQTRRISSSMEGEILVTELLNNYKIHYCNMRQAVEVTALTIQQAPGSKRLLFNLAKGLNNAAEGKELERLIEEFRFAIGTSWAGILAANIYLSCQSGFRVTESLSDLAESMRKAREVEEFSKRENNEAFLILKYLIPISAVGLAAGALIVFDMSVKQFLYYQFRTRAGITWFVLWIVSYTAAAAVNILFTRRKYEL